MKALFVPLVLFSLLPSTGRAQADSAAQQLTIERAVQSALEHNHELIAAQLEVRRAEGRVQEAWGSALPRIDLKANYTNAIKKPVFFLPDFLNPGSGKVSAIEIGSTHAFDMSLRADQILFNAAVFVGVGTAKIYERAAREIYRAKEVETVAAARKGFYGVLLAQEVRNMMESNLRNAEDNLRNVRILAGQGLVSEYDLLRAEVAVDNLRPEIIRAENAERQAVNGLKILLGIPYSTAIAVTGELDLQPMDEELLSTAVTSVLDQNPSLSALRHQVDVADAVVSVERSAYLPTLSAFGTYAYTSQKNTFTFALPEFIASSTVGLSLSLNIFNGLQTNARVEQAQLEFKKTEESLLGMENALQTTTESITLQIRRARQRVEAQSRTVQQAEKGYRIAVTRYTGGSGTQLEVHDAQLALTQAKVNRMQALYDYLVAGADLDQALGRVPEGLRRATTEID